MISVAWAASDGGCCGLCHLAHAACPSTRHLQIHPGTGISACDCSEVTQFHVMIVMTLTEIDAMPRCRCRNALCGVRTSCVAPGWHGIVHRLPGCAQMQGSITSTVAPLRPDRQHHSVTGGIAIDEVITRAPLQ